MKSVLFFFRFYGPIPRKIRPAKTMNIVIWRPITHRNVTRKSRMSARTSAMSCANICANVVNALVHVVNTPVHLRHFTAQLCNSNAFVQFLFRHFNAFVYAFQGHNPNENRQYVLPVSQIYPDKIRLTRGFRQFVGGYDRMTHEQKTGNERRTTTLGDCVVVNDAAYSPKEAWLFINYLDTGNITENRISEIQHLIAGKDKIPSRARRKVQPGDIVYSTVRPNQRHFGLLKELPKNFLASTGFAVIRGRERSGTHGFYLLVLGARPHRRASAYHRRAERIGLSIHQARRHRTVEIAASPIARAKSHRPHPRHAGRQDRVEPANERNARRNGSRPLQSVVHRFRAGACQN